MGQDVTGYQQLAGLQASLGADFLTVNIDGTQNISVKSEEMLAFLPRLVPALQEATSIPLSFDNPSVDFHREALKYYDRSRSPAPILNSLAASRTHLQEMIDLVVKYDTRVLVMASEKFVDGGSAQCTTPQDVYRTAKSFVELLVQKAGRTRDHIIIDPGLAPVGADTYGLVNTGLDAIRLIRQDPYLEGVHISVGLTNFSFGIPKELRTKLECAYITLAVDAGLDFVLGNPEKDLALLAPDDPTLRVLKEALAAGRPAEGESQEDAGFRQAEKIMELF